ncbi:MAG TPA: PAS domain S-box protein, partial [Ruminococcaceae bacterium]|nr:PAS domain S-box protein [Oscillospiraceae bacterium]
MIFKEENIMLPMLLDTLTQDEWKKIADESRELGYIIEDVPVWNPTPDEAGAVESEKKESGVITMPTGVLRFDEVIRMLNTMPFDITFVDKDDIVKYFSEGSERIFPRTKAVIGRNVANCHPPASVHVVEKIVEDFKSGTKDHEDFWINMGDKFVLIRYFAVRSESGEYLGVLEVTQNIKPIQEIKGEKRLASE